MKEYHQNADWADEANHEEEDWEESSLQCSPVGELITHNLLRHIPSQEKAGEERTHWHQQLCRQVITPSQEVLAADDQLWHGTLRQRAEDSDDTTDDGLHPSTLLATDFLLLIDASRTYLVHGDGGGQCRQHQQGIEEHRHAITHNRHIGKCQVEDIRERDENQRRTTIWLNTHREGGREYHQTSQDSDDRIDHDNLACRLDRKSVV